MQKQVILSIITAIRIHRCIIKMKATVFALAILCFSRGALGLDCDKGYYKSTDNYGQQICFSCSTICVDCDDTGACLEWQQEAQGVKVVNKVSTFYCYATSAAIASSTGYNPESGKCDRCMEGCSGCYIDFDLCTACKGGWEYNQSGRSCHRAETGLGATILAMTIIMTGLAIFACVTAK